MKTYYFSLTLMCTLIWSSTAPSLGAQNTKKWTLRECVEHARSNNITVQQLELDIANAEVDIKDAEGAFLPAADLSLNHSWNIGLNQNITTGLIESSTTQFSSGRLGISWDIYAGKGNIHRLHRSNLAQLASQYRLEDMKDDISLRVANAYLQIVFNRESLKIQRAQLESTLLEIQNTRERIALGVLPEGSILELEATLASQEQTLVEAENSIAQAKISLAQLLQVENYEAFDIVDTDYPLPDPQVLSYSPDKIYEKSLTFRNDIKASETNIQLSEKEVEIAKAQGRPTLSAFYGYDTRVAYQDRPIGAEVDPDNPTVRIGTVEGTGQGVVSPNFRTIVGDPEPFFDQLGTNDGHSFGLSLRVPIFNGFAVKNNVARNELNLRRSKTQLEEVKINLEANIQQAYQDALRANKVHSAIEKTLEARKSSLAYERDRFESGISNEFVMNTARQRVIQTEAELLRAKYNYIFSLKVLEFYFGVPLDEM